MGRDNSDAGWRGKGYYKGRGGQPFERACVPDDACLELYANRPDFAPAGEGFAGAGGRSAGSPGSGLRAESFSITPAAAVIEVSSKQFRSPD